MEKGSFPGCRPQASSKLLQPLSPPPAGVVPTTPGVRGGPAFPAPLLPGLMHTAHRGPLSVAEFYSLVDSVINQRVKVIKVLLMMIDI